MYLGEDENFLALTEADCRPERAGVVILPVPFEATSSYGTGSQHGPAAIIEASREVELYDAALGFEPCIAAGGIATRPFLDVGGCNGPALAERLHGEVRKWLEAGKFVIALGGEHTSVIGAVRAHCEGRDDVTVLQLDAHSDLRPAYLDDPWNHACAMARVLDFCPSLVQVGIRSQCREECSAAAQHNVRAFFAHDIHAADERGEDWIGEMLGALSGHVYVTLDCDVFDPAVIPATGTPEPGGLTWRQVTTLLARLCSERQVIGLDVSELAPIPGVHHPQFTIAKLIYQFIGFRFGSSPRGA